MNLLDSFQNSRRVCAAHQVAIAPKSSGRVGTETVKEFKNRRHSGMSAANIRNPALNIRHLERDPGLA